MSQDNEDAAAAFPTRRALREAGRAAAREQARRLDPADDPTTTALASAESDAVDPDVSPIGVGSADSSVVDRRSTPAADRYASPRARIARRWVPRIAVLGALAIATTAIPLSGAALPTSPSSSSTFGALSGLDVLAAEQVDGTDAFDTSDPFAADPLAAARALLGSSRSEGDRPTLQCGSSELEANGNLSADATTEPVQIMMPLTTGSYRLTSQYGYRWGGMHEGMDMAAPAGTPIHAVAAGEVTYVGYGLGGRSGMIIVLKHEVDGQTFWTWYIHMYPDGIFVQEGQQVAAGEVIGEVGSYGNSTGPHLHLEVHIDDEFTTVDPAVWLAENNAAPLTDENLACAAGS